MNKVSKNQITEWIENPVTIAVVDHFKWEMETIVEARGLNAFHPFQPERTQELLANLNGAVDTLERCIDAFSEGDELINLLEEEDDEHDGD